VTRLNVLRVRLPTLRTKFLLREKALPIVLRMRAKRDAIVLLKGGIFIESESGHLVEPFEGSTGSLPFSNFFFNRAHQTRVDRGCYLYETVKSGISEDEIWIFAPEA